MGIPFFVCQIKSNRDHCTRVTKINVRNLLYTSIIVSRVVFLQKDEIRKSKCSFKVDDSIEE